MTTTTPNWDIRTAAKKLDIKIVPFFGDPTTTRGISREREFGINPTCTEPLFVSFHEMAHILLGHTTSFDSKSEVFKVLAGVQPHEVQAHMTALAVAKNLLVEGQDYNLSDEMEYVRNAAVDPRFFNYIVQESLPDLRAVANDIVTAGRR